MNAPAVGNRRQSTYRRIRTERTRPGVRNALQQQRLSIFQTCGTPTGLAGKGASHATGHATGSCCGHGGPPAFAMIPLQHLGHHQGDQLAVGQQGRTTDASLRHVMPITTCSVMRRTFSSFVTDQS
jgi:hypothetical protein